MSSPAPVLPLDAYRGLVSLDTPFTPSTPASEEERPALSRRLREYLQEDGTEQRLREELGAGTRLEADERAWLRALLTVRGPQELPEDFHLAMDRLLQAERRMRPEVDPLRLPRLGD